jgi:hypothetical protein
MHFYITLSSITKLLLHNKFISKCNYYTNYNVTDVTNKPSRMLREGDKNDNESIQKAKLKKLLES